MLPISDSEIKVFRKLDSPIKIQDFLDTFAINFEEKGETLMSPRRTLIEKKAHCIEAALLAAAILWFHGKRPLLLDLRADKSDFDHVVALYKENGYWGALSKSNHSSLRYRDPVYKSIRELALSYFHEYFDNRTRQKTLREYSKPFSLKRYGTSWITSNEDLWHVAVDLDDSPHSYITSALSKNKLRPADNMEIRAGTLVEWKN